MTAKQSDKETIEKGFNPKGHTGCRRTISYAGRIIIFVFIVLMGIGLVDRLINPEEHKAREQKVKEEERLKEANKATEGYKRVGMAQYAGYFKVTVNSFAPSVTVNTGNQFTSIGRQQGTMYLLINATFVNDDDEGRTLYNPGKVTINYQDRDLTFDKVAPILDPGFGILLEPLNPMMQFTTTLVFPVPENISGPVYWTPERGDPVYLGTL